MTPQAKLVLTGLLLLPLLSARAQNLPAWHLVWSDEFNQPDGAAPDSSKWTYDAGGDGWGNEELQYYTRNRRKNARIEAQCLVIEAHQETFNLNGTIYNYTSARLKTQGLWTWTHGRFEARMKLPRGQGLWPALWMLGADLPAVGWPACGEIDIMENIGREPATVHGSAHGPGYSGETCRSGDCTLTDGTAFADRFHLFAVEWEPGVLRWAVDNQTYFTLTPAHLNPDQPWLFEHPFFLIVNLAVGGLWPGAPDATTSFPQRLTVDYVRVYARTNAPAPSLCIQSAGDRALVSWPATFPHARLQRASSLGAPWQDVPLEGMMQEGRFVSPVEAGVFRLR